MKQVKSWVITYGIGQQAFFSNTNDMCDFVCKTACRIIDIGVVTI